MLTTGQIAKVCGTTIRTVQFYDRENLLKPSALSEGGRRLYTKEDVVVLKTICLYKQLGFSLEEIQCAILHADTSQMVRLIQEKRKELQSTVDCIQKKQQELSVLSELVEQQHLTIDGIEQIQANLIKKQAFSKLKGNIYIALALYLLTFFILLYMVQPMQEVTALFIVFSAFLCLLLFVYVHAKNTAYICLHCHKKFSLSVMRDICTIHDHKKGKRTICPHCKHKGWFQETYAD